MTFGFWNAGPKAGLCFPPVVAALVVSMSVLNVKMISVVPYLVLAHGTRWWALWADSSAFCAHDVLIFVGARGSSYFQNNYERDQLPTLWIGCSLSLEISMGYKPPDRVETSDLRPSIHWICAKTGRRSKISAIHPRCFDAQVNTPLESDNLSPYTGGPDTEGCDLWSKTQPRD